MALLAEEVVEEWLNRKGFFTIRGARSGLGEIDLLAVRPQSSGLSCRHVEVQASSNPVSFLTPATKAARKLGLLAYSQRPRTSEFMCECVAEWCEKKFFDAKKVRLREQLAPGPWELELVVHRIKHPEELDLVRQQGIVVHWLDQIVEEVLAGGHMIKSAAGASLMELVGLRPGTTDPRSK
jgi:hypothetical protein